MKIVKVSNLIINNVADYKGLDLNKIVGGTQLYPDYDNVAYFFYDGDVIESTYLEIVTEATYIEHKKRIDSAPKPITQEQQIANLKSDLTATQEAVDFLLMGGI